jgi:hypothetical protein
MKRRFEDALSMAAGGQAKTAMGEKALFIANGA